MATTTNYGWTTPDDTALVKDGAAAIRTLGSSVDTTTKNLNPSTTLGDIEYRSSTANTNTRLGVGTTGQVLTVAGGVPSWATPSGATFAGVRLTKSVGQTFNSNTFTKVTWDTETFDVGGYHDNSTNNTRITIPSGKAGYYQVNFNSAWAASASGSQRVGRLVQNGSATYYNNGGTVGLSGSAYASFGFADVIYAAVSDYFEIDAISSGATVNMIGDNGDQGASNFSMLYLGA